MPAGTPTYDQAPGGTRPTTADAEKEGYGFLRSGSDYQTFIPIISALDVGAAGGIYSPNLYYNVDINIPNSSQPDPSKYAFEAYYAPAGSSEPHINITNGQPSQFGNPTYSSNNTDWILNELRESAHNLPTLLTGTYNYGSLYRRLLPSVVVGAGGQLFINNANLPNSGGVNTANDAKRANFEVYTSSCGSRVQLDQGGTLTLGQPNDARTATVRIARNGLLDLRGGSQTVVNAGSVLRIGRGGTLVLRNGAALQLDGQLVLEDGAYVCVENPASIVTGSGGQLTASANAYRYANPALGLTGLACQFYPPCQAAVSLVFRQGGRSARGGAVAADSTGGKPTFNDCSGLGTITAMGTGLDTNFSWTVNGVPRTPLANRPDAINVVLQAGRTYQVAVRVSSACDGTLLTASTAVQGDFPYCQPPAALVAMYPNPATGSLDFGPATAGSEPAGEFEVSLYDIQGQLRWQGHSRAGRLHLEARGLTRGLYGAVITKDGSVSRRNLSLE